MSHSNPVPAATVAVLRANLRQDDLEVLLLKRNSRLVFHGGHWVFPGGRIDRQDFNAAEGGLEYPAARRAAVREAWEEAGITLDPKALVHTAHWTTPPKLPRRFSTWFFVCLLEEAVDVRVDNKEILDCQWLSPRLALEKAAADEFVLPRPTRATLADLADYRRLNVLRDALARVQIRVFPENSPYYRPREMGYPECSLGAGI